MRRAAVAGHVVLGALVSACGSGPSEAASWQGMMVDSAVAPD
jgi:hypothetical protein